MRYDAIVFDNDGVLTELTGREAKRTSIRNTLREFGVTNPTDTDVDVLYDVTPTDIKTVAERYDLDPVELLKRREADMATIQRDMLRSREKDVYEDVEVLWELPVPLGIVSNNQHRTIEHVIEIFGLDSAVETYYGRKPTMPGIDCRKPNPTYLNRAIADLAADKPLYVGDGNMDVNAAHRAGIDVAFLRRDHRANYELERDPTYEINGLDAIPSLLNAAVPTTED